MALITNIICTVCGQPKEVCRASGDMSTVCHECAAAEAARARGVALAGLAALTVEERLARVEAWIYDYKPPVSLSDMRRAVHRLTTEGIVEAGPLGNAQRKPADDRLVALVAGIVLAAPAITLHQVASQLEAMHERTTRGGTRWHPSSVRNLVQQAERRGLLGPLAEPRRPTAR